MLSALRKLKRPKAPEPVHAIPAGQRVYAVGDIHGRLDLFDALLEAIDADDAARADAEVTLILLGDLIDRGPDSAGVIARARQLCQTGHVRILMGNHEEMFLDSFEDVEVLRHFLRYGGQETLLSYPVDRKAYRAATRSEVLEMMKRAVPEEDREFIAGFEDMVRIGDYAFVHAGVRPAIPFEEQRAHELRWIREPFLSHRDAHDAMVVHGHTISDEVEHRPNRIGIDTGAYTTGRLTALGLEGTSRWLIEARESEAGAPEISHRSLL